MGESALTTSAKGTNWILLIGVMPLIGSCGQLGKTLGPTVRVPLEPISSVYPSGLEPMAAAVPTKPPAPDRFSTTTAWPRSSLKAGAIRRAVTSTLPPGANGTMIRIGSLG